MTIDWQTTYLSWDTLQTTLADLPPSTTYEFQIRAVDRAYPTNYGAWSTSTLFSTANDTTPPATPAAPTVAASLLAVQITHTLGAATGGTFNLARDLDHLEVHVGTTSGFTPSTSSLVGKLPANAAMLAGLIPAVGTFPVDTIVGAGATAYVRVIAVDGTGNRSTPSSAASSTAQLIDDAHISDLTASKITAGTITSALILGGSIKTATSGARTEQDVSGIRLYDASGTTVVDLSTGTGSAILTGKVQTGTTGQRIVVDPATTQITLYPSSGSAASWIQSTGVDQAGTSVGGGSSAALSASSGPGQSSGYANLTLSPYLSGTYNSSGLLAARTSGGVTTAYVSVQDASSDTFKTVNIGTATSGGSDLGYFRIQGTAHSASGGQYVGTFSGLAQITGSSVYMGAGSSYMQVQSTTATLYAAGGGNSSVQNSSGSYYSANGSQSYIYGPSGTQMTDGSGSYFQTNGSGICYVNGTSQVNIQTGNSNAFNVGNGNNAIALNGASVGFGSNFYNTRTSSFTANLGMAGSPIGQIYRLTSSARYKVDITTAEIDPAAVLQLAPVTYHDRTQWQDNGETVEGLSRYLGLIAEDVAAIPGLGDLLAEYDDQGRPDSVNYDRLGVALLAVVKWMNERLRAVEAA